jgi:hypothetical protein
VQAAVPDGDNKVVVVDGQCARQVNRVRSAQCVSAGEMTGTLLDFGRQLHLPGRGPELLPGLLDLDEFLGAKLVVPRRGRERRPDLRIGQAARQRAVAGIPELSGELAPRFLDQQLHQRA